MDRRHLYAIVDTDTKELQGTYPSIGEADRNLKQVQLDGSTNAALYNITHGKTPEWVKDLASSAHGLTAPEAEIHMRETLVRISSRYTLSRKSSSLMMEEYRWIPDLDDYLESMPGFVDTTVEISDPNKVVITVDMEVADGGDTKDPVRREAFQKIDQLLVDIARFKWHSSSEMKDDPFASPVYTATNFIIVRNERDGTVSLNWADGDDTRSVEINSNALLARLPKAPGSIAREDDRIEKFASLVIKEAAPGSGFGY